jgi:uncharacterized protein YbjT (DUF2867 family)
VSALNTEGRARPVAVTGALGFVASRLIPRLRARDVPVIGIVRPGRDAAALAAAGVMIREADLGQAISPAAFAGAVAVVHLAGVAQATTLVPALEASRVGRLVVLSSTGVHTRLPSAAAAAKRAGEEVVSAGAPAWTVLRPTMIYGRPGDRNVERLLRWLRACPILAMPGGGAVPQQPVHVDDLVEAILAGLDRPDSAGQTFDLGGPEALSLGELVRDCGRAVGRRAVLVPVPLGPAHLAVRFARALRLPTPVRPEQILRLTESKAVDIGAARAVLGYRPRPFPDGVREEAALLFGGPRGEV